MSPSRARSLVGRRCSSPCSLPALALRLSALQGREVATPTTPGGTASLAERLLLLDPADGLARRSLVVGGPRRCGSVWRAGALPAAAAPAPGAGAGRPLVRRLARSAPLKRLRRPLASSLRRLVSPPRRSIAASPDAPTSSTASSARVAKDVVAEFADKGLTRGRPLDRPGRAVAGPAVPLAAPTAATSPTTRPRSSRPSTSPTTSRRRRRASLKDTPELVRAVKDMITRLLQRRDRLRRRLDHRHDVRARSSPAASGRSGRRSATPSTASSRRGGYRDLNANQKTFCEDAYGREQAFRDGGKNRNRMTTDDVARLFKEIARGEIAGPAGTEEMLALLSRDVTPEKPLRGHGARGRAPRGPAASRRDAASGRSPATPTTSTTSSRASLLPERRRLRARRLHEGRQDRARRHPARLREGRGDASLAAAPRSRRPRCDGARSDDSSRAPRARWSARSSLATARRSRVERLHVERYLELRARGVPILFALWHGRMFLSIQAHRQQGIVTMASQSKDGEIIARWLERNGYVVVRGSTTRGGGAGAAARWCARCAPAATPR